MEFKQYLNTFSILNTSNAGCYGIDNLSVGIWRNNDVPVSVYIFAFANSAKEREKALEAVEVAKFIALKTLNDNVQEVKNFIAERS